jgi:hypothetical protein
MQMASECGPNGCELTVLIRGRVSCDKVYFAYNKVEARQQFTGLGGSCV